MKKHGYDINEEAQQLRKIIKTIPISADKVANMLQSFGSINIGEINEFQSESEESDQCITDRSSKRKIENEMKKPNGEIWKFAKIKSKYSPDGKIKLK